MRIFSLPDYRFFLLNKYLLQQMRQYPEWFYDDVQIGSVYGTPPHCIWNGLQNPSDGFFDLPHIFRRERFEFYRNMGVTYRLYFANFALLPHHVNDLYSNVLAEHLDSLGGEALVSTEMMYKYLHKYEHLRLGWSDLTEYGFPGQEDVSKINKLTEKTFVVLPHFSAKNYNFLNQLQYRENVELQVGFCCRGDNPLCRKHREEICLYNIYEKDEVSCLLTEQEAKENHMYISIPWEETVNLAQYGFNHYFVNVLGISEQKLVDTYGYYFVKQEYGKDYVEGLNTFLDEEFNKQDHITEEQAKK